MSKRIQRPSMTARYAALFFAVIMLLAAGLSFMLMQFATERFQTYELQNVQNSMTMAANDLENQYEVFTDIASQIKATYFYRPSVLRQDAYRDIEMLEDFTYFRNFSPVLNDYFLLYPETNAERQKVYTSEGRTAYFSYYAGSKLHTDDDESSALLARLNSMAENDSIVIGQQVLLVFPIRFVSSGEAADKAVLGLIFHLRDLEARMRQIAPNLPDKITIELGNQPFGGVEEGSELLQYTGVHQGRDGHHSICVDSETGLVRLAAAVDQDKWSLLFTAMPWWLIAGMTLCLLVASVIAMGLSHAFMKPLRRLIKEHMPEETRFRDEFAQLEEIFSRLEQECDSSMQLLRGRLLLTILRGYYSESLMNRWGILHLTFDEPLYSVMILDTSAMTPENAEKLPPAVEALSDQAVRFYAVYVQDDRHVAVIAGFEGAVQREQALQRLQNLAEAWHTECFAGKACDSPQQLSISYMEAVTACLRSQKWQNEDLSDMHTFAALLVAAAERGDEEGIRQLCSQLMLQTEQGKAPRILLGNLAARLTTELGILASERHVMLDRQKLSMLLMMPSMELLLKEVCAVVRESFFLQADAPMSRVDETAQAIVEYVRENAFDADFDLSRIGERFGLSNDYISMMIKKVTGSAFKEYLTELRMLQASKLLKEHDEMTVNDVSLAVGYRKTSNFIKKFKERYGCTPAQYR